MNAQRALGVLAIAAALTALPVVASAAVPSPAFERACEQHLEPAYVAVDAEFRKWTLDKKVGLLALQQKAGPCQRTAPSSG